MHLQQAQDSSWNVHLLKEGFKGKKPFIKKKIEGKAVFLTLWNDGIFFFCVLYLDKRGWTSNYIT